MHKITYLNKYPLILSLNMKSNTLKLLGCAALSFIFAIASHAQSVSSTPVGYVTQTISAGTGTGSSLTVFGLPLYSPSSSGSVTSASGSTLTDDSAAFGNLADASTPYSLKVSSGTLQGSYFPIVSNTATTVTVTGDLSNLSASDTYELVEVDTLSSLFGNPSAGVIYGGSSTNESDIVWVLTSSGTWSKYFNDGTNWRRIARGNPISDNYALAPDSGVLIQRYNTNASSFVITGTVPSGQSVAGLSSSGLSIFMNTFPVDITLSQSGIQNATEFSSSDLVYSLTASGTWSKYFHDGSNWRRQARGNPLSDDVVIASGSGVLILKASPASSSTTITTALPYTL